MSDDPEPGAASVGAPAGGCCAALVGLLAAGAALCALKWYDVRGFRDWPYWACALAPLGAAAVRALLHLLFVDDPDDADDDRADPQN